MPTYEFINKKTKKLEEHTMSVSLYDECKEKNPHLERYIGNAPLFSYNGAENPRSPLADKVLKKNTKRVKTDQVLKKHKVFQQ